MHLKAKMIAAIWLFAATTATEATGRHFNGPVFSPDGKSIYYHEIGVGIWAMNRDGTDKRPITAENKNDRWVRFSADGAQIGFVSPMRGQPWSAYIANRDGTGIEIVGSAETDNWQLGVSFLSDGRLVYGEMVPFQEGEQIQSIYLTDRNQSNPKQIAKGVWPALSPNRSKVVYSGERKSEDGKANHDILVYDLEKGEEVRLTDHGDAEYSAVFSHDGQKIYYVRTVENNSWLMVMNADGSDQRPLGIAVQADSRPAASPDGQYLLFAKPNFATQQLDILQLNLKTGDQTNLTADHP